MSSDRDSDLHTETFSNARGWTVVRVTHLPTALVAERTRSQSLRSPVQAQQECIEEIRQALAEGAVPAAEVETEAAAVGAKGERPQPVGRFVSREDFDKLVARVTRLERRLRDSRKT